MSASFAAVAGLFVAFWVQAAAPPSGQRAVQFLTDTPALKAHATVVNNELTITAGAREPYLSSVAVTDFEIVGKIRLPEDADAALLLYAWEPGIASEPVFPLVLANSPRFGVLSGDGVQTTQDQKVATAFLAAARDWQWVRVSCIGRHVRVSVPAGVLTEGDLPTPEYGRMGIQVTSGSVSLRNWQFVRGDRPAAARPLMEENPDVIDGEAHPEPVGLKDPKLRREVKPQYTANAMRRRVHGDTELEAIVERDGFVGPVRITKSLDRELDIQAVRAVRQWRFTPALKNGEAVRCRVTIILTFTL